MKKLLIIGLLLCLMSGCQKNTGTFAQGDKNLSSVFADINEQIADGAFSIPLLKDTALSEREVEALYQLDMTKIESCMVKTAAVQAQLGEIALFQVKKEHEGCEEGDQKPQGSIEKAVGRLCSGGGRPAVSGKRRQNRSVLLLCSWFRQ